MYSCISLMGLIAQRVRGTGGAEVVVTDVDIRCRHTAGAVCDLVEMADCLNGGGNPNAAGERDGSLCLRKSRQAIVGLTGDVCRVAWVNDSGASGDNDGVVGKSGGEGEGGSGSLIGVHVGVALFPHVLLGLASGGALSTVRLLLLLASLLLLQRPVPPLLLLPLLLLLQWLLLLLQELGVPRVALDCANLVRVIMRLLLS